MESRILDFPAASSHVPFDGPEVSLQTESEAAEIKASDILEFGDHGASYQTESGFEEVKIDV